MKRLVAAGAMVVVALASAAAAAPERVTIFARPTVLGPEQGATLFGSVDGAKADESVTIEARDCGQQSFRGVASARARTGGGWSTEIPYNPYITTTLRAVWNDDASAQITVRQRASVRLTPMASSTRVFVVAVVAKTQFWRRQVVIQRFDRRLGNWVRVKSVVLTKQAAAGLFVWTSARFTASVPKGTLLRAMLPLSQARPCYLAGVSRQLRT